MVNVTVDAEGKIVAIEVDSSKETPNFGTRCAEDEAFLAQFVGQTIPVTVDALSGATVTSNAIVTAINSLTPAAEEVEEEKPAGLSGVTIGKKEEEPTVEGEVKTASAKGFKSDVVVNVTVDAEGKITALELDVAGETPTFGGRCPNDEAFMNQFIGQTIPVTADVLSGATVTSNAIINAINSLAQ